MPPCEKENQQRFKACKLILSVHFMGKYLVHVKSKEPHLVSRKAVKVWSWWKSMSALQVVPWSMVYYLCQNCTGKTL